MVSNYIATLFRLKFLGTGLEATFQAETIKRGLIVLSVRTQGLIRSQSHNKERIKGKMFMRYFKWFIIINVLSWCLQNSTFAQEEAVSKMSKEIPAGVQLFSDETLRNASDIEDKRAYFIWPSTKEIASRLCPSDEEISVAEQKRPYSYWIATERQTVTEAKRMAAKWIRTVLKNEWIPDDLDIRLMALNSYVNGYDAICIRYAYNKYYIQIVQTNSEIAVTIKPFSQKREIQQIGSEVKQKEFISKKIELFFNESGNIRKVSTLKIETFPGGFQGKPVPAKIEGASNQWWGRIHWFTDGETIGFLIPKYYGGSGIPVGLPKDWF